MLHLERYLDECIVPSTEGVSFLSLSLVGSYTLENIEVFVVGSEDGEG